MAQTELMATVCQGRLGAAQQYTDQVQLRDSRGATALMLAAERGYPEFVPLLLGSEARLQNNDGWTALMSAAYHGHTDCVRLLLCEAGVQSTHESLSFPPGITALMLAAHQGHVLAAELLLPYEQGLVDSKGHSARWYLQQWNETGQHLIPNSHAEVLDVLGEEVATRLEAPERILPTLFNAAILGNMAMATMCLGEAGQRTASGQTALMLAATYGHANIVYLLRDKEAGLQDDGNWTALTYALAYKQRDCALLLIEESKANSEDLLISRDNWNGLFVDRVLKLLDSGLFEPYSEEFQRHEAYAAAALVARKQQVPRGCTILIAGAILGRVDLVTRYSNQARRHDSFRRTALMHAVINGNKACVDALVEREVGLQDFQGMTALMLSVCRERPLMVPALFEKEAGLQTVRGWTALTFAALYGHVDCAFLLLSEAGIQTSFYDQGFPAGTTAMMVAARKSQVAIVYLLQPYEQGLKDSNEKRASWYAQNVSLDSKKDTTPNKELVATLRGEGTPRVTPPKGLIPSLYTAAIFGDVSMAQEHLHQAGSLSESGETALMLAAYRGHLAIVDLLLEEEMEKRDRVGMTALHWAAKGGHPEVVATLLISESGLQDNMGLTALMYAVKSGNIKVLPLLLCEAGIQTSQDSEYPAGTTALMIAAYSGLVEAVKLLLPYEQGLRDTKGHTARWWAESPRGKHETRYCDDPSSTQLLFATEETERIPPPSKEAVLLAFTAARGDAESVAKYLSSAGYQDPNGKTALMLAAQNGHDSIIPLISKEETLLKDSHGWTALMYAAHGGHIDCVRLLLSEAGLQSSKGASGMPKGTSALMLAATRGSTDIVALLEPYELGLRDSQGNTAGHIARANPRNSKELIALLERDSPDNLALRLLPPAVDITPLIQAVIAGDREAFHAHLDEAGRKDTDGRTALMYAAERGEVEFVRLLRTQELRMQDQEGRIALMLAAQHGEIGCVKLLLEEADLENSRGESALDIAGSVGSKASHHTRCQCCARILRDDAGAGVGVGRHLSAAQRKLLTMQELSTAFSGDDAQHVENAFSNIIAELNFLRQLTEQQDRRANAAEIAALQRRLEEKDAEVAAERQEYGRRIAELTAHLQERTDELEKRTLELQTTVRMPQPILTGDGYTLDELELLEKNLTTSLKAITTSRAVLQSSSCIVCLMNPKDTLLQPCNHLCVCSTCAEQIMNQTCPLCRTSIDNTVKVHL